MQAEINSYQDIGHYLRDVRESLGLDLRDIGQQLNIRPKYLIALESGTLDALPGKVYARGYVQNYAEFLGLDKDEIASAFDRVVEKKETAYFRPEPGSKGYQPGMLVIGLAILAMLVMYVYWYQSEHAAVETPLEVSVPPVPDRLANPQPVDDTTENFIGPPVASDNEPVVEDGGETPTLTETQSGDETAVQSAPENPEEAAPGEQEALPWLQE